MRHILALSAFCLVSSISAQELWVDAIAGADTNPGTPSSPLQSISAALNQAAPNGTIYVRPGNYSLLTTNEQFPLQIGNGLTHDGLTVYGFDGAVVDFANGRGTGVQIGISANGARVTGLTFVNQDPTDWWTRTISAGSYNFTGLGSSTDVEIDRCRFVDVNRGIVLWQVDPAQPGTPISGWKIHDNLFLRLGNDGINEFDPGSVNEIHDNTFAGGAHLGVLSDANGTVVANNVLTGLRVGIACGTDPVAATSRVHHNSFWMNSITVEGAGFPNGMPPNNLIVDPLFTSPANDDYSPGAGSPLIDAGDRRLSQRADLVGVAGAVDSDIDGSVITDIGGYETTPVAVTASITNGVMVSFQVTTTAANLPVGFVLFGFEEGLIQLPGLSPILIDPAALITPGFAAPMPYMAQLPIPVLPIGFRFVVQGFGFDPNLGRLVSGAAVRLQL